MREYFDDFNDIELDDNELIDRLMREWEMEDRRKVTSTRRGPGWKRRWQMDDDGDEDFEDDAEDEYGEYEYDDESEDYDDDY